MCGRYITKDQRALERELPFLDVKDWPKFEASYNVAPTQPAPVVITSSGGNVCQLMRFGLIPFFAKGVPGKYSTINARAETVETSAAYRGPWKRQQRCLVLAGGFYEWHLLPDGKSKQPYFIKPADQDSFAFAGLWDASKSNDGTVTYSFTIITLPASPLMAEIHNTRKREPALLTAAGCRIWLGGTVEQGRELLQPYPDNLLVAWPVSRRVNSPSSNDEKLIQPVVIA
ncbi:MAG TPA: SOS response-associated peptidase [Steroidobacteraceae bacterium]|jgi:putative SOS response-associated peptidase YedK|nr:SOS response-associated peptidase [Steroidobacteraceae bacterium]